jgi:hypothetical protein
MISRAHAGLLVRVLATTLGGCERGRSAAPRTSSPAPVPATPTLIAFAEPDSGFSTSELHDVQEQVLQLNTANELIWTVDGTRLPGYRVDRSAYSGISIYANVTGDTPVNAEVVRR